MKTTAVYPGTFDPVTYGHIDLIKRALGIFDKVIVAVAENPQKEPLFNVEERISFLKKATRNIKGVNIQRLSGLAVDFARGKKAKAMIRGLRMVSDFEYEFQMALTNRKIAGDIETIFMMPSEQHSYVSSKLIKEAASLGASIDYFVPRFVEKELKKRL